MAKATELTPGRLREALHYCPLTGLFTRLGSKVGRAAGKEHAGGDHGDGFITLGVDGVRHRAVRLAWLYMTDRWPQVAVRHRNEDRADLRWANLYEVNLQEKAQAARAHGVEHRPGKPLPYRARIRVDGKKVTLGSFRTEAEARAAYLAGKAKYHPAPANLSPKSPRRPVKIA